MAKLTKKQRILAFLKKKKASTTAVSFEINANQGQTKRYLEELESEGKIKREQETAVCYWSLK